MLLSLGSLAALAQRRQHHTVRDSIVISKDSTIYRVDNLGPEINEGDLSSGPAISPDGKTLYFFKIDHPQNIRHTRDIWVSEFKDTAWTKAKHMDPPINNFGNNSVHSVTDSGRVLILHNRYLKNGTAKNGVSWSKKQEDGTWSFPKNVSIKKYKNLHDCSFFLTEDGQFLLLAIKGKNSLGKQDLYVAFREGDQTDDFNFSAPVNLGPVINTVGSEATAFLLPDNRTMFFSTDGRSDTHGGYDIYKTTRLDTNSWTSWSKPENIGAPFNTKDNEFYFSVPDSLDCVYMSRRYTDPQDSTSKSHIVRILLKQPKPTGLIVSGKILDSFDKAPIKGTVKFIDLATGKEVGSYETDSATAFSATLKAGSRYAMIIESPEHFQKVDTLDTRTLDAVERKTIEPELDRNYMVLHGHVLDAKTMKAINAELFIINAKTGEEFKKIHVDPTKEYQAKLPIGGEYEFKYVARSEGYLNDENKIDLTGVTKYQERAMDILLQPKRKGITFTINNIYFAFNKSDLLAESFPELDKLADILKDAPEIRVEISGHTDNVGNDAYNQRLSQGRAQSVVNYLVGHGIPADQLVAKGYGESKPIRPNNTDANRAKNRRVEFKILEIRELPRHENPETETPKSE